MSIKLYSFVNSWLSPLQKGLQTAHGVASLIANYEAKLKERDSFIDWADNHKTIIILNGGSHIKLQNIYDSFLNADLMSNLVFEDEGSLNNSNTATVVLVPERIYSKNSKVRKLRNKYEKSVAKLIDEGVLAQ